MLDPLLRPLKERWLAPLARASGARLSPLAVTLLGGACGLAAAVAAGRAAYGAALALWWTNRALDGLDGTVARVHGRQSDMGGYVDLLVDFAVYAAIPIGVVAGRPSVPLALAALAMLASFYVNAASWMYLSALLERRGAGARARGELTSVTMPDALVGGTETVVLYTLFLAWPGHAGEIFAVTTALVLLGPVQRLVWAHQHLRG